MRIETAPDAAVEPDECLPAADRSAAPVAGLQRLAGGPAAVTVGAADDPAEHAADAVASRVVAALRRHRATSRHGVPADQHGTDPAEPQQAPLAALRRQAERTSVVGRSGGPLPAAVAGRLGDARAGGSPLPPGTRTAFEQALGADLGGVRLHAGRQATELNQQVGARAFTIGQDIFFAGGVPDTGTEAGQQLLAHELAHAVSPAAGGLVRRAVVAQLQVDKEGESAPERITGILIVGRPPPTFSGSMGDHTTAWTVHVNAVEAALIGQPLADAPARMQLLVNELRASPGAKSVENLPPRQANLFREAYQRVVAIHGRLESRGSGFDLAAAVQEYVAAYLELREIVPLSTVNVAAVSKGLAGRGHGEDCTALRDHVSGTPQKAEVLAAQVVGLLDVRAVALACAEPDPVRLAALAPGLSAELDANARAYLYVEQHLRSIQTAFPGVLAAVADGAGVPKGEPSGPEPDDRRVAARARDEQALPFLVPDIVHRVVRPRVMDCLVLELPILQNRVTTLRRLILAQRPVILGPTKGKRGRDALDSGKGSKEGEATLQQLTAEEAAALARLNAIEKMLGRKPTPPSGPPEKREEEEEEVSGRRTSGRKHQPKKRWTPEAAAAEERAKRFELAVQQRMAVLHAPAKDEDAPAPEDLEEAEQRKGSLAIQVLVGGDAGTVTELRTAGRPPSPFGGSTMGAHTTAWTVHVDRVRQLIVGQTVAEALKRVTGTLAAERAGMTERLGASFAFPSGTPRPVSSAGAGRHNDLLRLQNAILVHLEEVNLVPGAALSAADTGGKSEGRHRRVLLEHLGLREYATKQVVQNRVAVFEAIVGLIDVGSLGEVDRHKKFAELLIKPGPEALTNLVTQHLVNIEASYPGALKDAGLTGPGAVNRVIKALGRDKEPGRAPAKGEHEPSKRRKRADSAPDSDSPPDGSVPPKLPPPSWESSIFGTPPSGPSFDGALGFSGSMFGVFGRGLPRGDGSSGSVGDEGVTIGEDWVDADANLRPAALERFELAYVADIAEPGVYLAETEGHAVANEFRIRVAVYRDGVPPGFDRIENVAGGDCLIHACADIRRMMDLEAGGPERPAVARAAIPGRLPARDVRAVDLGEIRRIRGIASARADRAMVRSAVQDIVGSEVEGRGTPGLGPAVSRLLSDPALQYRVGVIYRQRLRKQAAEEVAKARSKSAKKEGVSGKKASKPVGVAGPPRAPQAQLSYGTAVPESANYALLHTGGNHYVALIRTGGG